MKMSVSRAAWALCAALALALASCASAPPKKVTYKCLSSSCDATVVCNEGDPVPQHCGKPMIR
jgi:hypothetical protein